MKGYRLWYSAALKVTNTMRLRNRYLIMGEFDTRLPQVVTLQATLALIPYKTAISPRVIS